MRKNRKNNSRTRGKRICIVAILLASSLILAGCGIKKEKIADSELPEIVIGIDYFEPYSYQTDDGQYKGIDVELAKEFFRSHERFPNSICSHPYPEKPWNKTLATMVFDLTEGEMHIAFGNACETPFNSYKFEHYYEK